MRNFRYRLHVWRLKHFSAMAPQWRWGHPDDWSDEEWFDFDGIRRNRG